MWERGNRTPDATQRAVLDEVYEADGSLVEISAALGTPNGLPPRTTWAHNFQGGSAQCWGWLRPTRPGSVHAVLRWAAFHRHVSAECDERGIFITSPASMSNPAAWIFLREPGWVDFGGGTVPPALGVPILDALTSAHVTNGPHSVAGLVSTDLVERFRSDDDFAQRFERFFGSNPELVKSVLAPSGGWHAILDVPARRIDLGEGPFADASRFRDLRLARGYSQAEVAARISALLPESPVSDDQIGLHERGRRPRVPMLEPRLDSVYGADGRTCTAEVAVSRSTSGRATIEFPAYWIGPVWFSFEPQAGQPSRAETVRIQWGPNHRRLRICPPTLVTCRRSVADAPPVTVSATRGWRINAGVGHREHAVDVNWGWEREGDVTTPIRRRNYVDPDLLRWFGRTPADLADFLRANPTHSTT